MMRRTSLLAIAAALALLVGGAMPAQCDSPPITLATLPFYQASAKESYAPLAEAIGDMVMVRLAEVQGLTLVDRTAIDKVLKEHESLLQTSQAGQSRLGRIVGAKFVLTGSVTAVGEEFQINAHLLDVSTARVVRSAKASGRSDRLVGAIEKMVRELIGELKLKLPELAADEIDKSPEANLHFMRGLGYYFAKAPDEAIVEFMKVLAIDSLHARARFWNGMAYFDQGEHEHAKLEFARFLREFEQHGLAPRAREMLTKCEAQSRKSRPGETP